MPLKGGTPVYINTYTRSAVPPVVEEGEPQPSMGSSSPAERGPPDEELKKHSRAGQNKT
jgi:hypothetical protein